MTQTAADPLDELPPLLSVAQVAEVLQCSRQTVYAHINDGTFPLENVGTGHIKFRKADLQRHLDWLWNAA